MSLGSATNSDSFSMWNSIEITKACTVFEKMGDYGVSIVGRFDVE